MCQKYPDMEKKHPTQTPKNYSNEYYNICQREGRVISTYHTAGSTSLCRKTFLSMADGVYVSFFPREEDTEAEGLLAPCTGRSG